MGGVVVVLACSYGRECEPDFGFQRVFFGVRGCGVGRCGIGRMFTALADGCGGVDPGSFDL